MFALDSDTLIYFFKGAGNVGTQLHSVSPKDIVVPSVVLYEMETGIGMSANPQRKRAELSAFIRSVNVLPFDADAARATAVIRVALQKEGRLIDPVDLLIAGTAIANGAILVTHNTKEFLRVPHLRVEDWY